MILYCVCVCVAPSTKRRGCCKNNAQCYGATGGVLLLLALLALAIWLGGTLCFFFSYRSFAFLSVACMGSQ